MAGAVQSYNPKVNAHVTYWDTNRKPRPATITAVTSATVVTLRVVRSGETHAAVAKRVAHSSVTAWAPA